IVLMPRAVSVAGFSDRGDLLMIKNNEYKKTLPQWIIDFFEHQFLNDQMLSAPHKVTSVFVATDKNLLVPETLYKPHDAEAWLKKLHYVESNEIVTTHHLREDKAYYLYAWPSAIKSLINRYFTKSKILPFSTYQFYKPFKAECSLQMALTSDRAFATLYKNRELTWHQVFNYKSSEDIAYQVMHAANQFGIEQGLMAIQCTVANKELAPHITDMLQFFPGLKDGTGTVVTNERGWVSNIYLIQQLYACGL
ncbi:MAG: DUF3822 family protein, partial [Chitinophagaceae bacterium]|nr:DUF3822 family protein [Chitinophagaceae bacterium]